MCRRHCNGCEQVSQDGGDSWSSVAQGSSWEEVVSGHIDELSPLTILRFTCKDAEKGAGGFVATVDWNGLQYHTADPIERGLWSVVESSDGQTDSLEYKRWSVTGEQMADDAVWIWNGQTGNTMVFEFRMGFLLGVSCADICFVFCVLTVCADMYMKTAATETA